MAERYKHRQIKVKPQLLNFIYVPINSGKTSLITSL